MPVVQREKRDGKSHHVRLQYSSSDEVSIPSQPSFNLSTLVYHEIHGS